MNQSNVLTDEQKLKKIDEQRKALKTKIVNAKKKDMARKKILLGELLLKKAEENPDYVKKVLALIEEYADQEEREFFQKLTEEERFFN